MSATNAAQRGATALVPPKTAFSPSTNTLYPVFGSASPATSGTPRPPFGSTGFGTPKPSCHVGRRKAVLTPPPVAPPLGWSFQTVSRTIWLFEACNVVPPHPSANELEAGKSTWFLPSFTPSDEPLSPDATQTVTPMAPAA